MSARMNIALLAAAVVACGGGAKDDVPEETDTPVASDTDVDSDQDTDPPVQARTGEGTITTDDGADHTWHWRVPEVQAPAGGRAVLVWLHGDGGSGDGLGAGFHRHLDADGAVLVTPDGANRTWTHAVGELPGQSQDAQFLSRLIAELVEDGVDGEAVDPARVYVGGLSRGAYMPYYLLQRADVRDRIAAVAVNAGLLYCQEGDAACVADASDPMAHASDAAVFHVHGTNDRAVAPAPTAAFHDPIDWNVDWKVFSPMNLWARQHGCFGGDNATGKDDGVEIDTFTVNGDAATTYDLSAWGPACARYQLTLVEDGGHVIGGMEGRIWAFLQAHGG